MNVWNEIKTQKENALNSNKEYKKFLEETLDDPLRKYFQESWKNKIPLEYHTEAVGKPVYHPLTASRILLYFNHNKDHLGKNKLGEESLKWFGMTLDSLKDYVEKGWVIVQLDTKDKYNDKSRQEIEDFFMNLDAKPIYVNIVDDLLPSYLGHDNETLNDFLNKKEKEKKIKNLYNNWCNIIKEPIEMHGVRISPKKVRENYLKLEFFRDIFENKGDQETVDAINTDLKSLEETADGKELSRRTYTSFLIHGTPILYCDGSGYVSVGLEPYWYIINASVKTRFKKIKVKAKKVSSSIYRDQKILYFPDIKQPHEIIKNHFKIVKQGNVNNARELEKEIGQMIEKVYHRVDEKRNYIKAFKSYENEAVGSELRKITFPLTIGTVLFGLATGGVIGSLIGLTPSLTELKPIKTIALKYIAGNKIFGMEIKEREIPDLGIKIPEAYKDFRFRTLKIPVKNEDPTSGRITTAKLR